MKTKLIVLAVAGFALMLPGLSFGYKDRKSHFSRQQHTQQTVKDSSVEIPATTVKAPKKKPACPAGDCKRKEKKSAETKGPAFVKDYKDSPTLPKSK